MKSYNNNNNNFKSHPIENSNNIPKKIIYNNQNTNNELTSVSHDIDDNSNNKYTTSVNILAEKAKTKIKCRNLIQKLKRNIQF